MFPVGQQISNQTPMGPTDFYQFVTIAFSLGNPGPDLADVLVFGDEVSYSGIDLILGRRFWKGRTIQQPPVSSMVNFGGQVFQAGVVSLITADHLPPILPGRTQDDADTYTRGSISALEELVPFSSTFNYPIHQPLTSLCHEELLYSGPPSEDGSHTLPQYAEFGHDASHAQQYNTFLDVSAGAVEAQAVSAMPLPDGPEAPGYTLDGKFDILDPGHSL
ncbi:hypothetical protein VPNG_09350 [Cytospora leucostoma]|uniref:Uncharacterized protein n=1 Tax=Cytospora leucostoma TaxID=1230097 RepID=A0A423VSQ6_9PEZI|nr:hypothetical protein VPNG_09350 [Cytospora leucostoma]